MRQIHSVKCYAVRKAISTYTYCNIYDPGNTMLSKRSLSQKTMLYYFIYINCREEANPETEIRLVISWGDPLEEEIATTQVYLTGKITWMEQAGGLWSMRSQRVRHDWVSEHASVLLCTCIHAHTHTHTYTGYMGDGSGEWLLIGLGFLWEWWNVLKLVVQ